jgi:hypothetical protein
MKTVLEILDRGGDIVLLLDFEQGTTARIGYEEDSAGSSGIIRQITTTNEWWIETAPDAKAYCSSPRIAECRFRIVEGGVETVFGLRNLTWMRKHPEQILWVKGDAYISSMHPVALPEPKKRERVRALTGN